MTIETQDDVAALKRIGRIVSLVLQQMLDAAEPGMTTRELDALGEQLLERHGARSAPQLTLRLPRRDLHQHQRRGRARHPRRPGDPRRRRAERRCVGRARRLLRRHRRHDASCRRPTPLKTRLCHATRTALAAGHEAGARRASPSTASARPSSAPRRAYGFKIIENLGSHGVGRALHEAPEHIAGYFDPTDTARPAARAW